MSHLTTRTGGSRESRRPLAVTCFCENCDRLLYVADPDSLFCPVCSSLVARIDVDDAVRAGEEQPTAS